MKIKFVDFEKDQIIKDLTLTIKNNIKYVKMTLSLTASGNAIYNKISINQRKYLFR